MSQPDHLTSKPHAVAPPDCPVSDDQYTRNMLDSLAGWLESRSQTVWAKEYGHDDLMQTYGSFLRRFTARRAPPPSASTPEYNMTVGERGEEYLKARGFDVRCLPGNFYWQELWDAMRGTAVTKPEQRDEQGRPMTYWGGRAGETPAAKRAIKHSTSCASNYCYPPTGEPYSCSCGAVSEKDG